MQRWYQHAPNDGAPAGRCNSWQRLSRKRSAHLRDLARWNDDGVWHRHGLWGRLRGSFHPGVETTLRGSFEQLLTILYDVRIVGRLHTVEDRCDLDVRLRSLGEMAALVGAGAVRDEAVGSKRTADWTVSVWSESLRCIATSNGLAY